MSTTRPPEHRREEELGPAEVPGLGDHAVVVSGLVKAYGGRAVVDGLTFEVDRGEVFALLGPNGAGKTTTIEILEGYRSPDRGSVLVLGLDPKRRHARLMERAGLMLQQGGIYPSITVAEALALFGRFYRAPLNAAELLDDLGLRQVAGSRYRQLSGGQQQRLSLALALIGKPELIFLDEPTAGMDPQARRATWEIIRALKSDGVTVLLTTHFMDEAEELADRVAIIDHGRLVALDEPAALRHAGPATQVYLSVRGGLDVALISSLPAATGAREDRPGRYLIETDDPSSLLVELTTALRQMGIVPDEVRVGGESLEDVYLRLTSADTGQ